MPAPNATRSTEFDELVSTTLDNYRPTLTDNVWNGRPTHYWLFRKGRRRMLDGGNTIVEPLIYAGGQAGFYGQDDIIEITPQTGITAATFDWASVYATMYISAHEKLKNSGKEQIISLTEAKVMQAEETLKDLLADSSYAETPATVDDFLGLGYLINDEAGDTASSNVVGGITTAAAAATWWESVVKDGTPVTGDYGTDGIDTGAVLRKAIRSARNSASDSGSDRTDAAFTPQQEYGAIEDSYVSGVRYEDVEAANAGFENIEVSKMPLFWDFKCPASTVFGVNSKYLTVVGHSDRWMHQSPFSVNPVDSTYSSGGAVGGVRDGQYSFITAFGNLTVRNRARQFRINNIEADIS